MTYPFWILVCRVAARRLSAELHCSERCTAAVSAASQAPYPIIPSAEVSRCPSCACSCQENPPSARCHTKMLSRSCCCSKSRRLQPSRATDWEDGCAADCSACSLSACSAPAGCSACSLFVCSAPAGCSEIHKMLCDNPSSIQPQALPQPIIPYFMPFFSS